MENVMKGNVKYKTDGMESAKGMKRFEMRERFAYRSSIIASSVSEAVSSEAIMPCDPYINPLPLQAPNRMRDVTFRSATNARLRRGDGHRLLNDHGSYRMTY